MKLELLNENKVFFNEHNNIFEWKLYFWMKLLKLIKQSKTERKSSLWYRMN